MFVNERAVGVIRLTTIPFFSGSNVRKDIDVVEASNQQIDLKFIDWKKDKVELKHAG